MKGSRNAPCPCGSGRKYKRCCLAAEREALIEGRREDAVGRRIAKWTRDGFEGDLREALGEFDPSGVISDADLDLFTAWFHNDRELRDGLTPAELYSRRGDIDEDERLVASRIAGARLGIYQVVEVAPGTGMVLVDQIEGGKVRVVSRNVSREPVRWDLLLGRLMEGNPPTLWGATRIFKADEEEELFAELARLARAAGAREDRAGLTTTLSRGSLELFRYQPPSSTAERSFYTLEGDPLLEGRASWRLSDPVEARARLADLGGLDEAERAEGTIGIDMTAPRAELLAEHEGELPAGAVVIERGTGLDDETEAVASVSIEGSALLVEAMSERRLLRAVAAIEEDFGGLLATKVELEMVSIERRLADDDDSGAPDEPLDDLGAAEELELMKEYLARRYRGWLDDPNPSLGGATPRRAARGERRDEVLRLARRVENGAARSAREHGIGVELDLLGELDFGERAA